MSEKVVWRKARKKPVIVEFREVEPKECFVNIETRQCLFGEKIETEEGTLYAICERDFIIRGIEGEIYPIKKEIFYKTYEVIEDTEVTKETSKESKEGRFEELKRYILENATKHADGTPIFSARYFAKMIDQAKKEYPYGFSVSVSWRQKDEWFRRWFGEKEVSTDE